MLTSKTKRIKRLTIISMAGIIVLSCAILGAITIQQKRQQGVLSSQIGWLGDMVSNAMDTDTEFSQRFEEIKQYIPVIASKPLEGQITEIELIESVHIQIIDKISDPIVYPEIDTSATGNFSIKHTGARSEAINGTSYKVLTFNIQITDISYDQLLLFISDISSMQSLRTLVISKLSISPNIAKSYVNLDFDIYGEMG